MRKRDWTDGDNATVHRMFRAGCEDAAIAERLGRTVKAVEGQRTTLGLYRQRARETETRAVMRARKWSPEETDNLIQAINMGWNDERIAAMLGRSAHSVKGKRESVSSAPRSAALASSVEVTSGWPRASLVERKRGEALLDRALGGKPRTNDAPINAVRYSAPDSAYRGIPSTAAMAV